MGRDYLSNWRWKHFEPRIRISEAVFFLCLCLVTQSCPTLCDPMDCSPPGSSVLCPWGFSRQEYWSGLPSLPSGDLPNIGIKLLLHCRRILYGLSHQGSPNFLLKINCISNMKKWFFLKSPMEGAEIVEGTHGEGAFHWDPWSSENGTPRALALHGYVQQWVSIS